MKIIGITTSVNYSDYLAASIGSVVDAVDFLYVVTQFGDTACDVAAGAGAVPLVYDGWQDGGACFNKSGAVRHGQSHAHSAHPDAWYLLVDADIILPGECRGIIERHATDEEAVYGCFRDDYYTQASLDADRPNKSHDIPLAGYFQLYRRSLLYPSRSDTAAECDLAFVKQFDARNILPMRVRHLGPENTNWTGRRSPRWPT